MVEWVSDVSLYLLCNRIRWESDGFSVDTVAIGWPCDWPKTIKHISSPALISLITVKCVLVFFFRKNVCIERKEEDLTTEYSTTASPTLNYTAEELEISSGSVEINSCSSSIDNEAFTCVTEIHRPNAHKKCDFEFSVDFSSQSLLIKKLIDLSCRLTVKHQCCHGFVRDFEGSGCIQGELRCWLIDRCGFYWLDLNWLMSFDLSSFVSGFVAGNTCATESHFCPSSPAGRWTAAPSRCRELHDLCANQWSLWRISDSGE